MKPEFGFSHGSGGVFLGKKGNMIDWKKTLLGPDATIRDAIATIDSSDMQVAFIVDTSQKLLGMITDRDVRRGLLKKISLEASLTHIMNASPTIVSLGMGRGEVVSLLKKTSFRHIPVLDKNGRLVNVVYYDDLQHTLHQESWVVVMAGGLGSRLRPLTNDCPKPLLKVGDKPLLETILDNFIEYGFYKFFFSVNYKSEMIEEYFGDGSRWNVTIQYLREDTSLGTAGALSLLPEQPLRPFIVMNGDLLTKVNFQQLIDFHIHQKAQATMCVREYDFQVPYGVVKIDDGDHRIHHISEKPVHRFFVNAGIYVLQPEVLSMIPENHYYDMPSLFDKLIQNKQETSAFPIREYWMDIGKLEDLKRANGEFSLIFQPDKT